MLECGFTRICGCQECIAYGTSNLHTNKMHKSHRQTQTHTHTHTLTYALPMVENVLRVWVANAALIHKLRVKVWANKVSTALMN